MIHFSYLCVCFFSHSLSLPLFSHTQSRAPFLSNPILQLSPFLSSPILNLSLPFSLLPFSICISLSLFSHSQSLSPSPFFSNFSISRSLSFSLVQYLSPSLLFLRLSPFPPLFLSLPPQHTHNCSSSYLCLPSLPACLPQVRSDTCLSAPLLNKLWPLGRKLRIMTERPSWLFRESLSSGVNTEWEPVQASLITCL